VAIIRNVATFIDATDNFVHSLSRVSIIVHGTLVSAAPEPSPSISGPRHIRLVLHVRRHTRNPSNVARHLAKVRHVVYIRAGHGNVSKKSFAKNNIVDKRKRKSSFVFNSLHTILKQKSRRQPLKGYQTL
jgi:hypothetical protein